MKRFALPVNRSPILAASATMLALMLHSPATIAQTGPLEARIIMTSMATPPTDSKRTNTVVIPVRLTVATDGHVSKVELDGTSGNPKFDEKLSLNLSRVRYVPALTAEGVPFESIVQFIYKDVKENRELRVGAGKIVPNGVTASTSGKTNDALFDEVGRINRMRCQDFLWEYDLIKDAARSRPFYDEFTFRTIRAMYTVYRKVEGERLNELDLVFHSAVRDAADACRDQRGKKFFEEVMAPELDAKLGPAGR